MSTFSISGSVGVPGAGATVTLSGDASATATADVTGAYSFSGLAAGNYVVTPTLVGAVFSPLSHAETIVAANIVGVNFIATFTISGTVGAAGAGATILLSGDATASATANGSGDYSFSGLVAGNYKLTPGLTGLAFSPVLAAEVIVAGPLTANFTTYTPARIPATFFGTGMNTQIR